MTVGRIEQSVHCRAIDIEHASQWLSAIIGRTRVYDETLESQQRSVWKWTNNVKSELLNRFEGIHLPKPRIRHPPDS